MLIGWISVKVFEELSKLEGELLLLEPIMFYQNVSTSKELRDASNQAEVLLRDFNVEVEMRVDVFTAKKHAQENITAKGIKLTSEEQRLVDKMMLEGTRAGLDLSEEKRKLLTEKKKELSQLCVEFGVRGLFSLCCVGNNVPLSDCRKTSTKNL